MTRSKVFALVGLLTLAACGPKPVDPEPQTPTADKDERVKNIDKMPGFVQPGARTINEAERLKAQLNQQNQDMQTQLQQETQ